jgi:hypothetical protein
MDLLDQQEKGVHLDSQDPPDLKELVVLLDLKVSVVILAHLERKDPPDHLDLQDPLVPLAPEAKGEKRDPKARMDLLASVVVQVTRDPLALLA